MKIDESIFKEYDMRGLYPKEINEKTAYEIGRMFCAFLKIKQTTGGKIVVGHDNRTSSPKLSHAFVSGIIDSGINVIDIGNTKTPMLYFAIYHLKANGGAMITASHNMKKYNGIKFARHNTEPISGLEIKKTLGKTSDVSASISDVKSGILKKYNIEEDYFKKVFHGFDREKIKRIKASFDPDADRLMIIKDKKGNVIRGDIIGGIIADAIAKKGDKIIYDIRCSHAIPEYFKNKGVIAIPSKVGHFNIKKLMRKKKAIFSMEISGHYYFKNFNYCESPHFGLRILEEQMERTGKNLKELSKEFAKYYHTGIIDLKIKNFQKLISKLKEKYKNSSQNFTDGLTIEYSNWWFNVKESHTEPLLRLAIETNSEKLLKEKLDELKKIIKRN
jgi:phosphomannomutase